MRNTISAALLLASCVFAAPAQAAGITPAEARAVADQVIALIGKNYVFPDKRAAIVAKLRADEAAGRYDVSTSGALVDRLGADMSAAGNDRHLWIHYDPDTNKAMRNPSHEAGNAFFELQAVRRNSGYEAMRILPGNVRYVNLTGFIFGKDTARTVADVARFMAGGDAVILDLRENGGGSADAVQALVSYFLPPDNRVLMMFHQGADGAGTPTRVLGKLAGPRMVGKPLYVLTSESTGSAAEEFSYHVQQFHLGTLVGHATAGAANNNSLYPVGDSYVVSVSTDRPEHPVSHTNWEGAGVAPDVVAPVESALDQAELLALKALAARPGARVADYEWAMTGLAARANPVTLDAAALAPYAGVYGERTVTLKGATLLFQRQGRPQLTLTPLAADLFAMSNSEHIRVHFRRDGARVTGFDLLTDDGQVIPAERTAAAP